MKHLLLISLYMIICQTVFGQNSGKDTVISFSVKPSSPAKTEKPEPRTGFQMKLKDFNSIRLYHALTDGRVKHINPEISQITNDTLINDLKELFAIINESAIDSQYIGSTPKYDHDLDIKVLFLQSLDNEGDRTFEIFLQDNDYLKMTIRDYYYMNGANYYELDANSVIKIRDQLVQLINKYTTHNKSYNTWTNSFEEEMEVEDVDK